VDIVVIALAGWVGLSLTIGAVWMLLVLASLRRQSPPGMTDPPRTQATAPSPPLNVPRPRAHQELPTTVDAGS
jgi:hypothetical protein